MLEELFRIVACQRLDRLPEAAIGAALAGVDRLGAAVAILVERVRGDAVFGDFVHIVGADLQLDALAAGADDGGVDRAIVVLLRRRDVVLEAAGHVRPGGVGDADGGVAVGDGVDEDAEAVDVGELLEGDRIALHLAPDRIGLLLPPLDLDFDAAPGELVGQLVGDAGDQRAVLGLQVLEPGGDQRVGFGHEVAERQLFQLAAHALHAHAAGERGVDVERVLGDAGALGLRHEIQRAHVVQAVGELDQQHARVVGDGEQELAEILRLLGVLGGEIEFVELGEPVDQAADLGPEDLVDLLAGGGRVLDRVVQHRGDDRRIVELEIGQDRGDLERMGKERIARGALLRPMGLHRVNIGAIEQVLVGVRIVAADALNQFILPHH